MSLPVKSQLLFGAYASVTATIMSTPSSINTAVWSGFNKRDLCINVTAFTGTSQSVSFDVYELIGGTWFKALNSGTISSISQKVVLYRDTGNSLMGKGTDIQVISNFPNTIQGSIGSITANIFFVNYNY